MPCRWEIVWPLHGLQLGRKAWKTGFWGRRPRPDPLRAQGKTSHLKPHSHRPGRSPLGRNRAEASPQEQRPQQATRPLGRPHCRPRPPEGDPGAGGGRAPTNLGTARNKSPRHPLPCQGRLQPHLLQKRGSRSLRRAPRLPPLGETPRSLSLSGRTQRNTRNPHPGGPHGGETGKGPTDTELAPPPRPQRAPCPSPVLPPKVSPSQPSLPGHKLHPHLQKREPQAG